jgi:lipid-binding SYLF domain-containing protein
MIRLLLALTVIACLALPRLAMAQAEQQDLVDRATLTLQGFMTAPEGRDARGLMQRAHGALICPRIFQAGFILGGRGGSCVLVGRINGNWSYPAFYSLSSGSVGFQAGIQDSELLFVILTDKGLQALIDNQFKVGADAGVSFATYGTGVASGTTGDFKADIVSFARSRGLFAGLSLDGSLIEVRSAWNALYYGRPMAAQQLVIQGEGSNPGAAPLREVLARFSAP